jgi:hypothetical protein
LATEIYEYGFGLEDIYQDVVDLGGYGILKLKGKTRTWKDEKLILEGVVDPIRGSGLGLNAAFCKAVEEVHIWLDYRSLP